MNEGVSSVNDDTPAFAARLARLAPATKGTETSALREAIRKGFAAIREARARGVLWQQIAAELAADGIRAADGTPPTEAEVRVIYHQERYAQGEKRQRRKRTAKPATAVAPPSAAPRPPAPASPPEIIPEEDEAAPSAPVFRPARPKG